MHRWLVLVLLAVLSACGGVPTGNAAYVKEVVAYREGDNAILVYAILADSAGRMIAAPGKATLRVRDMGVRAVDANFLQQDYDELLAISADVGANDFQRTSVGRGAFAHEAVLLSFGRITFDRFSSQPRGPELRVVVEFSTKDGRQLQGTESYYIE